MHEILQTAAKAFFPPPLVDPAGITFNTLNVTVLANGLTNMKTVKIFDSLIMSQVCVKDKFNKNSNADQKQLSPFSLVQFVGID